MQESVRLAPGVALVQAGKSRRREELLAVAASQYIVDLLKL